MCIYTPMSSRASPSTALETPRPPARAIRGSFVPQPPGRKAAANRVQVEAASIRARLGPCPGAHRGAIMPQSGWRRRYGCRSVASEAPSRPPGLAPGATAHLIPRENRSASHPRAENLSSNDAVPRLPLDIRGNLIEARWDTAAGIRDRTPRLQPKSETSGFAANLPGAPAREDGS
jgi:hypothetical protein